MKALPPRTALITGASRGFGLALARRLATDGWQLVIDGRDVEALSAASQQLGLGTRLRALAGDVADGAHRADLARAAAELGGLDVLVNNASTLGPSPRPWLRDYSLAALADVYRTNVLAQLGVIQDLSKTFKPGIRVVNVTSDAAVEPYAGWGGYGSSKAALEQVTRILAVEQPEWRVYLYDPGDMRTDMHQAAFPGEDISDRPLPEASVPALLRLLNGERDGGRYRAGDL